MRQYNATSSSPTVFTHSTSDDKSVDDSEAAAKRKAADVIAQAVKDESAKFSRRIPASVKVVDDGKGNLSVQAGGVEAPNAYPFDPPDNPPVRNPVYAKGPRDKWTWVNHPYRPFLEVAAESSADDCADIIADWAEQTANEIGSDKR